MPGIWKRIWFKVWLSSRTSVQKPQRFIEDRCTYIKTVVGYIVNGYNLINYVYMY